MELPERKVFTVSELTESIRDLLESNLSSIWVQGEISNLKIAPSGHSYFTLKDNGAQIRCVLFKIQSRFLKFKLSDGLSVIGWGRLSVYSIRGEYQLVFDTLEPAGLGGLMLAFEQLKAKLNAEGLFDKAGKKVIPRHPKTIGLVTSSRGAAVQDMIRIIRRRSPNVDIIVSSATVQGDRAPREIEAAIKRLCSVGNIDVIIVGRGGGSIEDLWAFNDEQVVRAVAGCPLPIVSAVGHETDFTLTDFAADLRASTPSAAAELVVPDKLDLENGLFQVAAHLKTCMFHVVDKRRRILEEIGKRLQDPRRLMRERSMRLDELQMRMVTSMKGHLTRSVTQLHDTAARLRPQHLMSKVSSASRDLQNQTSRMERLGTRLILEKRTSLENLAARLDTLSPLAILGRGYSITYHEKKIVSDTKDVDKSDHVIVVLNKGELFCKILDKLELERDGSGVKFKTPEQGSLL